MIDYANNNYRSNDSKKAKAKRLFVNVAVIVAGLVAIVGADQYGHHLQMERITAAQNNQ